MRTARAEEWEFLNHCENGKGHADEDRAEGVETKDQVDFLRNIGCIYGQGYYYYKPLPVEEAEQLLMQEDHVDYGGIQARQLGQLKLEDLFNENITSEAMLNNMLGAIALYEVYEDRCEVLRVNQEYYRITGDNPGGYGRPQVVSLKPDL